MRILVVEEDTSLASFMRALLESWGHEVTNCLRGEDAPRIFRTSAYDLVLMEVFLSDIKGEELITRLKEVSPETWIVTMTENNSREVEVRIREQGILYYMVKPFETENLRSLLEHLSKKIAGWPNNGRNGGNQRWAFLEKARMPHPSGWPHMEGRAYVEGRAHPKGRR